MLVAPIGSADPGERSHAYAGAPPSSGHRWPRMEAATRVLYVAASENGALAEVVHSQSLVPRICSRKNMGACLDETCLSIFENCFGSVYMMCHCLLKNTLFP